MSALRFKHIVASLSLLASVSLSGLAFAHAHLESQFPAANSTVTVAKELRLHFSEGVEEKFTKVSITSTAASGKTMVEAVPEIATDPADNKILIVKPAAQLTAGEYKIEWHAVSVDTHKSEGTYSFTVSP
ncbi:copper homeostasis periplasmic binding protein CopC [Pseudomonas sp. G.S.17]|uniref:copper homeostasis periplasmic binding protein CopC n=1 Tax=Pseudomonas sp. G.S.17 TaxID=3137451 RepID=UPI00311CDBB7